MIDYTKPTPWRIGEACVNAENNVAHPVIDKDGMRVADFYSREDAERACLLAAAAEVQERRSWGVVWDGDCWHVPEAHSVPYCAAAKDPSTAIVEADLWMRQQEKGA